MHIVKKLAGIETAKVVADFSVVDAIPKSQNLYVPEGYQASKHPFLAKAEYAIRKAHYQTMNVTDLAKVMAVSERTLNRKLKELTGETPKAFIDGIRISHACTLLVTTNKSVKEIAFSLGYSDDSVFSSSLQTENEDGAFNLSATKKQKLKPIFQPSAAITGQPKRSFDCPNGGPWAGMCALPC